MTQIPRRVPVRSAFAGRLRDGLELVEEAVEVLQRLDLDDSAKKPPEMISGGWESLAKTARELWRDFFFFGLRQHL